jgi:acyl-CoA thioester hydrolase
LNDSTKASARPAAATRGEYRYHQPITTRWMDNDAYGHVNNVHFLSYFDTVVNTYLIRRGALDIQASPVIGLVVETGCQYLAPLTYPETVTAGLRVAHVGRSSVRYEIAPGRAARGPSRRARPAAHPFPHPGGCVRAGIRTAGAMVLVSLFAATASVAQAPGIKRTVLQRIDIGNNMEVIVGIAEIAPGGATGRHTHFGIETGYALAGQASLEVEGEAPKLLNAGDSYVIAAGKVHDAKVVGDGPAKVLAVYVVEKRKPLATPAP